MSGVVLLLDLLKKSPSQSLHSYTLFCATVAASSAAASIAAGKPFASRSIFGDGLFPVAYCDAGAIGILEEERIPNPQHYSESLFPGVYKYRIKEYPIELKPLFSAFGLGSFGMTSLRSFLLYFLPLLDTRLPVEEDDGLPKEAPEQKSVDLVTPFLNSVKQIFRETSIVTTKRVLQRLAVHYFSRRVAWKLTKDIPRSAGRKAARGMSTPLFCCNVIRTTFRGHCLAVVASWFVQVVIEVYRCFFRSLEGGNEDIKIAAKFRRFGKKLYGTTLKCSASLVLASMGGGIGALFHPTTGQWIGCALGDYAGPIIAVIFFEKLRLDI